MIGDKDNKPKTENAESVKSADFAEEAGSAVKAEKAEKTGKAEKAEAAGEAESAKETKAVADAADGAKQVDELSDDKAYDRDMFGRALPGETVDFAASDGGETLDMIGSSDSELSFTRLLAPTPPKEEEKRRPDKKYKVKVAPGGGVRSIALTVAYIAGIIVVGIVLGIFLISAINDVFAFSKDTSVVPIEITDENMTLDELAELLHEEGIVKYPALFKLYISIKRDGVVNLVPGTYNVSASYNYDKLAGSFHPIASMTVVTITFPEGITTDEVIQRFVDNGIGSYEGFYEAIEKGEFDYWFLEDLETTEDRYYRLDGYLYPDTYQFYSTSSEETVLKKMLNNFRKKFSQEYMARVDELGVTLDQAVTIASMIQAEASRTSDYVYVSAVFHNRLVSDEFTKFESDATVQYVLSHEYGGRHEELTAEDLLIDSPYNTRLYDGFPPGPICNVSLNALKAAIYPDDDCGYYYFVTGNDGYMMYAATYAEHLNNIAEIEKGEDD